MRDRKKLSLTYHQLVLMISLLDMISSATFIFETFFLPMGSTVPQAKGSLRSCTVLGVLIQMGFISVYFNAMMAVYFWLVVAKGWTEDRLKKVRARAYALIMVVGVGVALGGIPLYKPLFLTCYVGYPPLTAESWIPVTFFYLIPIGVSIFVVTFATVALFLSVYRLEVAAAKWRLTKRSGGNSMTDQVFWRCFWYLLAFYVPFPIQFASYFVNFTEDNYPFYLALCVMVPLQGILNCLVYYQRSIASSTRARHSIWRLFTPMISAYDRWKENREKEGSNTTSLPATSTPESEENPSASPPASFPTEPAKSVPVAPKTEASSSPRLRAPVTSTSRASAENIDRRLNSMLYYEQSVSSRRNLIAERPIRPPGQRGQAGADTALFDITDRDTTEELNQSERTESEVLDAK